MLETYLDREQVSQIYRAYLFGAEAHKGQKRMSGEPYIYHPIAVARIIAEMHMDDKSIIAAILHDVIEDTETAKDQIVSEFGEEVAELVDGVSKLTHIQFENRAEAQAENFRKMILAMVQDIRVILVKLADRLHNMRTLGVMPAEKKRRIARETLDIYAPIAHRLGMHAFRMELEELGFSSLYPLRYRILAEAVKRGRGNRKEVVERIQNNIGQQLEHEDLAATVVGREKHLYSLYRKMRDKRVPFNEVFDVYAFRVIVSTVDECYRMLGILHNLYKPVPGKFKDYIAIPKANGYQSLHTVLFGPFGVPIEMQVRTQEMDKVAEAGIAAHWLYKTGDSGSSVAHERARQWLKGLLEMQQTAGNSLEFLENVKVDLFPDVVYVFTPKGEIKELPRGSTAVDFAYSVHTDVGNSCVAVKINRRLVPLRTELVNGQTIEVITAPGARPNPLWLDFVVTGKARASVRHYLKNLRQEEASELGKRMLGRVLSAYSYTLDDVSPDQIKTLLDGFKISSLNNLLQEIGLGHRAALLVGQQVNSIRMLSEDGLEQSAEAAKSSASIRNVFSRYMPSFLKGMKSSAKPLLIKGTEGMVVNFAKCCRPIPGDPILGYVTTGRGIVVHRNGCKNVTEYRKRPDNWVEVVWEAITKGDFQVDVRIDVENKRGVLAMVAATIAESGSNIDSINIQERDGRYSQMQVTIEVSDRKHLANIIRHVKSLELVSKITRIK